MWYFAWILGVLLACAFGIINVLWLEAQESLEQDSAVLDPLTKTLIRFEFLGVLRERIEQRRFERRSFCLLMMGLDGLSGRSIADEGGKGDLIRLDYTGVLREILPKPRTILARYDACTFAAILANTDAKAAESYAEKICCAAESRNASPSECASISIGITECRRDLLEKCGEDANLAFKTLLESADQAMQQARLQGRNKRVTLLTDP
ncbi:MAG: cytochrome bd-I oxidase subunit CydX [Gammaproteobacteria bacterium]